MPGKISKDEKLRYHPAGEKARKQVSDSRLCKKVKRHRIRVGLFVAFISMMAACILALCLLTISDMRRQANPSIINVEAEVYNLTAAELETTVAEVGEYILYTNTQRIQVSIPKNVDYDGEIILWNATSKDNPVEIGYSYVDSGNNICVFANLSATQRYMVTCGGSEHITITISDGRIVSFWNSLMNVLNEFI